MVYSFDDVVPIIHESSFIHPLAAVTGHVFIGRNVYIGPGAALRGDWGRIIIEDGCNVQENCTIHMFPGLTVLLKAGAHIGHGAIIHGATIGKNCLVGMNAVVMDHANVGDGSVIGALSFIKENEQIAPRSLVAGNPAKFIREISDEMLAWKTKGTALYQQLPADLSKGWKTVEPRREGSPEDIPAVQGSYHSWKNVK